MNLLGKIIDDARARATAEHGSLEAARAAWAAEQAAEAARNAEIRRETDEFVARRAERWAMIAERVAYVQYATYETAQGREPIPFQRD